ncbi:SANT/Myb-like DNA-binding domain-containing protein [Aspergillus lucknowensis]|uniref:Uncharacterized protein n=1 Tax=Aspergillus lucknowensis TaxID=176173 RepID=A0ABR4M3M7_9EURO
MEHSTSPRPSSPTTPAPSPLPQRCMRKGTWSPAEDARLREAVAKHGTRWVSVASEVQTRNGDQCAKRWNGKLNPGLDHSPWTQDEDEQLLCLVATYGNNWKFMASSFFNARAPLALKNRHSLLMRRLKRGGLEQCGNDGVSPCTTWPSASSTSSSNGSIIAPPPEDDLAILQTLGGDGVPSSSPPSWGTGTSRRSINSTWDAKSNLTWPPPPSTAPDHTEMEVEDPMMLIPDLSWGEIRQSPKPKATLSASHSVTPNSEFQQPSDCGTAAKSVEYSVTCQRANLKSLVTHLVAAAMSETADCAAEEDQVTLTLSLKG